MSPRAIPSEKWLPFVRPRLTSSDRPDGGAALVEFALLVPVLGLLVVGLYTGGLAYKQNSALTQAVRDGTRFGALVDQESFSDVGSWMDEIHSAIKSSAGGALDNDIQGREVCIAYFDGSSWESRTYTSADTGAVGTTSCFSDSQGIQDRVQVRAERLSELDVLFWSRALVLSHESVAPHAPVAD